LSAATPILEVLPGLELFNILERTQGCESTAEVGADDLSGKVYFMEHGHIEKFMEID